MLNRLVALSGFVTGLSAALWAQLASGGAHRSLWFVWATALVSGGVGTFALSELRLVIIRWVGRLQLPDESRARYERFERWTYLVFALTGFTAFGLQLILPVVFGIVAVFLAAQGALLRPSKGAKTPYALSIGLPFLLSGMAALMYQVVWQRLLFAAIGVNIEAVTLIVAIFMLGLGLGSLAGGRLSLRFVGRLPVVFAALELGIAAFGAVSIPLISLAGRAAGAAPLPMAALTLMLLLLLPTLLMGATLPVLVTHLNRTYADVGQSVGLLYFVNTLGSAMACFATVLVLFAFVGLQTTVYIAVAINVAVAFLVNATLVQRRGTA